MIKVSVVVPVYNVEQYLEECLNSIVNQTLRDIEIICVNDGSTDSSYDILKRYEKMDARIKVISKENSGYGHTINRGVEAASGKYITIIESDDFAEKNMLEKMYNAAELNQVDAVKCNYYNYKGGKDTYVENLEGLPYNTVIEPMQHPKIFLVDASTHFMWKRTLFTEDKLRLNETEGASFQDISFQFQIWFYSKTVVLLKEALLHYRIDNESSSVNNPRKVFCVCEEFQYIAEIIKKSGRNMEKIWPYIIKNKFRTYQWNYSRISDEYQYAFLKQWSEELLNDYKNGIVDVNRYSEKEWREIQEIIKNRDTFFEKTAKYYFTREILPDTVNDSIYLQALMQYIVNDKDVIIYDAGKVGKKIADKIALEKKCHLHCFAVSRKINNSETIGTVPVVTVEKLKSEYPLSALIVVTVGDKDKREVVNKILNEGYNRILIVEDRIKKYI